MIRTIATRLSVRMAVRYMGIEPTVERSWPIYIYHTYSDNEKCPTFYSCTYKDNIAAGYLVNQNRPLSNKTASEPLKMFV
jgi:hypothetical protein